MELLQPQRFAMAELPAAKTFLEEQGYVVIRDVYTPEECDSFCARLKASVDALCPAAAAVPSLEQLAAGHLPPTDSNGLRSALAQSPAMWGIRLHGPTQRLHRHLQGWDADAELVVSLDKAVLQVGEPPTPSQSPKPWLHVDTRDPARSALQGTAYLRDASTEQHASLVVVPGSHRRHAELLAAQLLTAQPGAKQRDYVVWDDVGSLAPVQLALRQGDHVVWYSHTTHQGGTGRRTTKRKRGSSCPPLRRVAAMVSYALKAERPEKVRRLKQAVAEEGGCTTHWAAQCVKQPLVNRWPRKVGPLSNGAVNHPLHLPLRPSLTPSALALL